MSILFPGDVRENEPVVNGTYQNWNNMRGRGGPRHGRGARGGRAGVRSVRGFGRTRPGDADYPDYPTDYTQVLIVDTENLIVVG